MRGLLLAVTCLLSTLLIPLVIIHKLSNTPHQRHPVIRFTSSPPSTTSTSVLILCYNRPQYLDRTMRSLFSLPQAKHANIFISQDGNHQAVTDVITKWTNLKHNVKHLRFNYDEDKWGSSKNPNYVSGMYSNAYFKISAHYFFALDSVFSSDNTISEIIILEDDMELAIDFFPYFTNMRKLLEQDSSILCISAWNDNGQKDRVFDSSAFYRADVFPGLGWMIARKLWDELKPKWGVEIMHFPRGQSSIYLWGGRKQQWAILQTISSQHKAK
jgi:alpha-1,3-mannosyl-glycoprotein beta-1,2-N-acetylglucosaminyltransferase